MPQSSTWAIAYSKLQQQDLQWGTVPTDANTHTQDIHGLDTPAAKEGHGRRCDVKGAPRLLVNCTPSDLGRPLPWQHRQEPTAPKKPTALTNTHQPTVALRLPHRTKGHAHWQLGNQTLPKENHPTKEIPGPPVDKAFPACKYCLATAWMVRTTPETPAANPVNATCASAWPCWLWKTPPSSRSMVGSNTADKACFPFPLPLACLCFLAPTGRSALWSIVFCSSEGLMSVNGGRNWLACHFNSCHGLPVSTTLAIVSSPSSRLIRATLSLTSSAPTPCFCSKSPRSPEGSSPSAASRGLWHAEDNSVPKSTLELSAAASTWACM